MGKRFRVILVGVMLSAMLSTTLTACKSTDSSGTTTSEPAPTSIATVPSPTTTPSPVPPTPTATRIPVDVSAVLSEMELPADIVPESYTEFSSGDWGITPENISDDRLTVSKIILLMNADRQEVCMAVLFSLDSAADQALFDAAVSDSDVLVDSLVQTMAGEGVVVAELGPVTGLEGLGDAAAGYAFQYEEGGLAVMVDVIIFRRGPAGAMATSLYLDGQTPQLSVEDLAEALEDQFQAAFE